MVEFYVMDDVGGFVGVCGSVCVSGGVCETVSSVIDTFISFWFRPPKSVATMTRARGAFENVCLDAWSSDTIGGTFKVGSEASRQELG